MTDSISEETVRKAIKGAQQMKQSPGYWDEDGNWQLDPEHFDESDIKAFPECKNAICVVMSNYDLFENLLWKLLKALPLTNKFFCKLIKARLKQKKDILISPIISNIFFNDCQILEDRLTNIQVVKNIESLGKEYGGSREQLLGANTTDQTIRNLLAEILVLDFLIKSGFTNISKVFLEDRSKTQIDITAEKDGQSYAIEAIRKQEITDWGIKHATNLEDCTNTKNCAKISRLMIQSLNDKNNQFRKAIAAGTVSSSIVKVIALKTSDYGFAQCIEQAATIACALLSVKDKWRNIDCIWLMPNVDVKESKWVYRNINTTDILG